MESPWAEFAVRRYGDGFAPTGVASNIALPRLLKSQQQDWWVHGCKIYIGENFVSFGRHLSSLSRSDSTLFYGVDICFGDHQRASWIWYCSSREWLLQLHKAVLEPLAEAPVATSGTANTGDTRWPGRPHFLGEDPPTATQRSSASTVVEARPPNPGDGEPGPPASGADAQPENPEKVNNQLSLFLSNADGHIGVLSLPVPNRCIDVATAAIAQWSDICEVPLEWGGRLWTTAEDFDQLRESALNITDLLLLGLETDLAMTLTPDWTWEKYPRGFGEAAVPDEAPPDPGSALAEPRAPVTTSGTTMAA